MSCIGVSRLPSTVVQRWLIEIGERPADEIARHMQERYRREGFYDAVVTAAHDNTMLDDLVLQVQEGALVTFGEVAVMLPDGFDGEFIRAAAGLSFSGAASADNIEHSIARIVEELADAGYPSARVSPSGFHRECDRLSFRLDVAPGPPSRVGSWRIVGLERSDTARVRRLLGLQVGISWNREERSRLEEQVGRFDYFYLAGDIHILRRVSDSLVDVEIPLAERPAVVTDGGLGLTGGGASGNALRGRLNLSVENPFGDGRRLELLVSRPTSEMSESRLQMSDPHVAWSRFGAQLGLEQVHQSAAYDRVSLSAQGSTRLEHGVQAQLELRWAKVTPTAENTSQVSSRCYDVSISARRTRHPLAWQMGITASMKRDFANASVNHDALTSRARALLGLDYTWQPTAQLVLSLAGKTESWLGPDAQLGWGDELYLGGSGTVRGFPERSIKARGFTLISAEAGYSPAKELTAFTFGDLAFYRPFPTASAGRALHRVLGYGLGLQISNRLGRTRLEIGWPQGRPLGEGMLYFRWLRGW